MNSIYKGSLNVVVTNANSAGYRGKCLKCDKATEHRTGLCMGCRKQNCAKCNKPFSFNGENKCSRCLYFARVRTRRDL